jgi:hypothetical protein
VKPRNLFIFYVLYPVFAVLATLATGFLARAGGGGLEYGFPLPWKTVKFLPVCASCPLSASYNWGFFLLDVAYYAAIGYGGVFLSSRFAWKQRGHPADKGKAASRQAVIVTVNRLFRVLVRVMV